MTSLEGRLILDDGEVVDFRIGDDGAISRWGSATVSAFAESVDITEAIRDALQEVRA